MTLIAYSFLLLAGIGLGLSVVSHVASLLGRQGPLGDQTWWLHIGIFVVWLPAVIAGQKLTRNVPKNDWWKAALRRFPGWMRYATYGFFGYALVNFLIFVLAGGESESSGPMPPAVVRGFSGHWMIFYWAAFGLLYSYTQVGWKSVVRSCMAGHEIGSLATFCEQCGQSVPAPTDLKGG